MARSPMRLVLQEFVVSDSTRQPDAVGIPPLSGLRLPDSSLSKRGLADPQPGGFAALQQNRFEFKYALRESQVAEIRALVRSHLVADPFNASPTEGYSVHSLYLDSPSLVLREATVRGLKDRFKLRVRFYCGDPQKPAFFEIKARKNDAIEKERVRIRKHAVERVLRDGRSEPGDLWEESTEERAKLERFLDLSRQLQAGPAAFTSYEREAYVHPEHSGTRVTFDRNVVAYGARWNCDLSTATSRVTRLSPVILELKFTDRFPRWMHQLAERMGIERTSVPKYVACVEALRKHAHEGPR